MSSLQNIKYDCCNAMEKRILRRRPLNPFAVVSLKKTTLRRFLRLNGQRYKNRDRKQRLSQLITSIINRRASQAAMQESTMQVNNSLPGLSGFQSASILSAQGSQSVAPTPAQVDTLPLAQQDVLDNGLNIPDTEVVLAVSNCNNTTECDCVFTFDQILHDRAVMIPESEREMIVDFMTKSADEMKETLTSRYNLDTTNNCRVLLTKQLRDKLESIEVDTIEISRQWFENLVPVPNTGISRYIPVRCLTCNERPARAVMIPCGHVRNCMECAQRLSECPDQACNTIIDKIIELYMPS